MKVKYRTVSSVLFLLVMGGGCNPNEKLSEDIDEPLTQEPSDSEDTELDTATLEPSSEPTSEPTTEPSEEPICDLIHGDGEPLALVNECGTLSYGRFATEGQSNLQHILPDFSHAGYMRGGVSLPEVPVFLVLTPSIGDDTGRIQGALDEIGSVNVDSNGFRGALLLTAGEYVISSPLEITASGVVLRGEGQGDNGTIIRDVLTTQHTSILLTGAGNGISEVDGTRVDVVDVVGIGDTVLLVTDASGFVAGDQIGVQRVPNQSWIDQLGMSQFGWTTGAYSIVHERTIESIRR